MSRLTDINLSILADIDKPADWELEDYVGFSQEAAREILELRALLKEAKREGPLREALKEADVMAARCDAEHFHPEAYFAARAKVT